MVSFYGISVMYEFGEYEIGEYEIGEYEIGIGLPASSLYMPAGQPYAV